MKLCSAHADGKTPDVKKAFSKVVMNLHKGLHSEDLLNVCIRKIQKITEGKLAQFERAARDQTKHTSSSCES